MASGILGSPICRELDTSVHTVSTLILTALLLFCK